MAKLSPLFNDAQLIDGIPASGGLLFTYAAGSSTKQTTYKDEDSAVAQSNPIVLNARGEPDSPIWLTEGLSYKFVFAPSDDTDPPASPIRTIDDVTGTNDASISISQWIESGSTPTYVNATQFTLSGDQTSDFTVNRRIKATVTAGTVYGYISASAYTSLTTVTVVLDSGNLDVGLSAVQLGLLTPNNESFPNTIAKKGTIDTDTTVSGALTVTNDITMSDAMVKWAKGADVASATALPLITDGNYFDVTGTTTITSFNSVGVGSVVKLHFDDVLTLTHNATDLILPGGVNITTAAGDEAEFIEYASGDYRCTNYIKANGSPIKDNITVNSPVATTSGTSVTLTSSIPSTAKEINLSFNGISLSGTDNILIRVNGITTGYLGGGSEIAGSGSASGAETTGFRVTTNTPAGTRIFYGHATIRVNDASNFIYSYDCTVNQPGAPATYVSAGVIDLASILTTITIVSSGGSATFDAGSVTVTWK